MIFATEIGVVRCVAGQHTLAIIINQVGDRLQYHVCFINSNKNADNHDKSLTKHDIIPQQI